MLVFCGEAVHINFAMNFDLESKISDYLILHPTHVVDATKGIRS